MNILFLTLVKINSIDDKGIYTDLLREFRDKGHNIFAVNPIERRNKKATYLKTEKGVNILNVKTLNIQKTNIFEKGIATLSIEYQFLNAIKKYFNNQKFDIILYSTPPITFSRIISFIKRRDNVFSYLLLKDIFPQNAVDMEMIKKNSFIHKYFLKKERKLYELSDKIGCMSLANVNYVLNHHSFINSNKVEINPNSIKSEEINISNEEKLKIKTKYKIPKEKIVFIYGGNLGIPQGVEFLIETIEKVKNPKAFFVIVGSGTQYNKIRSWFNLNKPQNAILHKNIPNQEYMSLVRSCDVGMIFLNKKFTIPNFPSRLLSYLEGKLPIIAATDKNTDIGEVILTNNCGVWIESGDLNKMLFEIDSFCNNTYSKIEMGENGWNLLQSQYLCVNSYELIINSYTEQIGK